MENKLQELTKKLYDEGLSKGREEADAIVEKAKAEAKKIITNARAEAEKIRREATGKAEELHLNTLTELNLAGKQFLDKFKSSIQDMIVARATKEPLSKIMLDPDFIKEMLISVAKNWKSDSPEKVSLTAMLPEKDKARLDKTFEQSVKASLDQEMEIVFSGSVKSGFKVGPKQGGYYVSFTEDGFDALLSEYLRPKVNEVLYGQN